jgi:hypothetical protein
MNDPLRVRIATLRNPSVVKCARQLGTVVGVLPVETCLANQEVKKRVVGS